jgi:hypothetical protein
VRDAGVVRRPRTGYVAAWGTTNEHGLGFIGAGSCGTWLDEPIADVWPIRHVPLLRFARTVAELVPMYERYRLYNWGRSNEIWTDMSGDAVVIEHSHRRIGVRRIGHGALWATEGHFQSDDMAAYLRDRRLAYVARRGGHLGADWGRGLAHMRRVLCDHAPFPRAVCRHGGPDTDPYDVTVTLQSTVFDFSANRVLVRAWTPWRRFCCDAPETVTQYPPRPCDSVRAT